MAFKRWADRNPYWFVITLELLVCMLYLLADTASSLLRLTGLALSGIANLSLAVLAAVMLSGMGWWGAAGFRRPAKISDFWFYLPAFIPMAINLLPGLALSTPRHVVVVAAVAVLVGFVQEAFFRGLMLATLKPVGPWRAVILTALLFGATRAMTLTGYDLASQAVQVYYFLAWGFAFGALALRKGLIWPLVLAHSAVVFTSMLQAAVTVISTNKSLLISATLASIFCAYAVFLMVEAENPAAQVQPSQLKGSSL